MTCELSDGMLKLLQDDSNMLKYMLIYQWAMLAVHCCVLHFA